MSDNFTFTQGTGSTGATDNIGGVHFPRVKIALGADGVNNGDVSSANPMPTNVSSALPAGANVIGQVTANAGTNLNTSALALESGGNLAGAATSLAVIDDWDETDRAKVNPIVGQAGVEAGSGANTVKTQRVTIATDDTIMFASLGELLLIEAATGNTSTNTGNIDTNTAGALTALQIMDDWDNAASDGASVSGTVAHDSPDANEPVKIGGRAQNIIGAEPEEVADNDRVDALFDRNGRLGVTAGSDYKFADINDSTSGDNTIIAAQAAGKRIAVWAILIVSDGTTDVRWEDGAGGTAFTGQVPLQAREGYSISSGGLVPLFVGSAATLLNLELTAAVNVHGFVSYTVLED